MKYHLHKYNIECSKEIYHLHKISGYSEKMIGFDSLHVHRIKGVSSYLDHTHNFYCRSGLPIKTKNGHIHKIKGILEQKNGHIHRFNGYTFEDLAYTPKKIIKVAFI